MKADKVIKPSKYFQMSKEGDLYTLRISEAFPEDEGPYKCIVSSPAGQTVLAANLVVLGNFLIMYEQSCKWNKKHIIVNEYMCKLSAFTC